MRVIPLARRLTILADCDAGAGTKRVAAKHGVSGTFVRNLKKERRETGTLRGLRKRGPGRNPKIDRVRVQELVKQDADATLAELRERLGVRCSLSAIWTVLNDLKITFKKNAPRRRARPPRRRRASRRLACLAGRTRPAAARLHRRNLGDDEHDPSARPGAARSTCDRRRAARALENGDADRRARPCRHSLFDAAGRPGQRPGVPGVRATGADADAASG
ncbi:MAG: hypothetical protein IPM64_00220 [Phycisphaerales bacterium]|nr:hypothetical protein [Phycisphaerales bacterium]